MKFSESWLREWVDPDMTTEVLAHELTMAGLEVDGIEPVAPPFTGVVVGQIVNCRKHPDADKLSVCDVDVGEDEPLQIVCGAPNVFEGMKAPTALVGTSLPGGIKIKKAKLRGVESRGMLCSESELCLGDGADGIMALDSSAPIGADCRNVLKLDESIIDLDLTPNRGDCFSVLGVARELGCISKLDLVWPDLQVVAPSTQEVFDVDVQAPEACPRFCGRVISGIDPKATTPRWMQEKLRCAGLRPISPVVDVTNFVMTELGQPLHGFDKKELHKGIIVRLAKSGEILTLLDGKEINLDDDMLVIADHSGPLALAGVMGGKSSGVTESTTDVFLEAAFFDPQSIAGRARKLGLHTDASLRFERGVDPEGQCRAIERATTLLTGIVSGDPGPVIERVTSEHLPQRHAVNLRSARLALVLGMEVAAGEVESILSRLGMQYESVADGWKITPPSWRFDIVLEVDLIEEIARINGYDQIPETAGGGGSVFAPVSEMRLGVARVRNILVDRGYQEVITYSFVDRRLQTLIEPDTRAIELANPISSEMNDMRVSLWPGLIDVLSQNLSRQQSRLQIFESGLKFYLQDNEIKQVSTISGLIAGSNAPEQWCANRKNFDFYDLKADVESLLKLTGQPDRFSFEADGHPALHPGQTARIRHGETTIGWVGALHPAIVSQLNLSITPYLFDIETDSAFEACVPEFAPVSRYPFVRRDLSVVMDEGITAARLAQEVRAAAGDLLEELRIFDVYRGSGVDLGRKSVALGLILQETSRTLTDDDADIVVQAVISRLEHKLAAKIRD
jgi:phenylalanyl-tRNA synthetase beta chain